MNYVISLKLTPKTHQRFQQIHQQLNDGETESLAKPLGEVLADISCEVIDQVFGEVARLSQSGDHESEKVIQQILEMVRKYMPWSVSFFGNERLMPMVNYLENMTHEKEGQHYLSYPVDHLLVVELLECIEQMKQGNIHYVSPALKAFIQMVDQGVTSLVREPKKMLKFNLVVDKTLNGVIGLTTQMGYKRLEKLGTQYDAQITPRYFDHFLMFLNHEPKSNLSTNA
ncbi:hypothetical protein B9T25_06755 [Acinetobacter sp. ANC 4470]|uniref:hypothetical protein n=1 Tax=Acinetobacter sp. ANC 4470 TaxID=1977881 RepID=UPI000A337C17|nr:hypothetical protein [Acinetobacter sp. ANC 4470]OTG68422.1 hypothetical protein B9T25_06755 [Acinetobacter sp. ANC 4470]